MTLSKFTACDIKIVADAASLGRDGIIHAVRTYRVDMGTPTNGFAAKDILYASTDSVTIPGVGDPFKLSDYPAVGSSSNSFSALWVEELSVKRDDSEHQIFFVDAASIGLAEEFGGAFSHSSTGPNQIFCWDISVVGNSQQFQEPLSRDYSSSSAVCRNLVGEPINPPLMGETSDQIYTINFKRNTVAPRTTMEPNYLAIVDDCLFKINPTTLTLMVDKQPIGFPPHTLKLHNVNKTFDAFVGFWQFEISLTFRESTFIQHNQSASTYVLSSASSTKIIAILDDNKSEITSPQFHTADGLDYVRNGGTLPPPQQFQVNEESISYQWLLTGLDT